MFNSIRMQKMLTRKCLLVASIFFSIFFCGYAVADDIRIVEKEPAAVSGQNEALAGDNTQDLDDDHVLAAFRLVQAKPFGNSYRRILGKKYNNNDFAWLKKPEISRPEMKIVKSGNKITIVRANQKDKTGNQLVKLAER